MYSPIRSIAKGELGSIVYVIKSHPCFSISFFFSSAVGSVLRNLFTAIICHCPITSIFALRYLNTKELSFTKNFSAISFSELSTRENVDTSLLAESSFSLLYNASLGLLVAFTSGIFTANFALVGKEPSSLIATPVNVAEYVFVLES